MYFCFNTGKTNCQKIIIKFVKKKLTNLIVLLKLIELRLSEMTSQASEIVSISIFAFFGVLARIGLDRLARPIETFQGHPYYSSFFSNLAGCFFIGLFGNLRKSLIATGLTTGFCGCFTTFSGGNHQQALTFFDSSLGLYEKGTSVVTWIVGLFSFVGALNCGKDLGQKLNELKAIDSSSKLLITMRIMFGLLVVLFSLLCGFFEKTR